MSKKSRHPAIKAAVSTDASANADEGAGDAGPAGELEGIMAELWEAVAAGDVLAAEIRAAAFVALPHLTDSSPQDIETLATALVKTGSENHAGEESAAFFRLLLSLGSRSVKREASAALAELIKDGVYPPSWVTRIGKPVPGRAWRRHDVFGDRESIIVTFSYDNAEHALLVATYLAELPSADLIVVTEDADGLLKTVEDSVEPVERVEEITLAQARQHIEAPLARAGADPDSLLDSSSLLSLPLARSRLRRLPSADPGERVTYTAADRAAAVEDFLHGTDGGSAGDPASARFWATVLTGYSSRVPHEPPGQVGPIKLTAALLVHIASTFTLTAAQHDGLRPAVTAWTRWAAGRQGLDELATDVLMTRLPGILDEFGPAYDDPGSARARGYLRDVAAAEADLVWLADQRARREFAAPPPEDRDPSLAILDATDADQRAVLAVSEFTECAAAGEVRDQLLTAVRRTVEEAWHDNPPATWEKARLLLADGHSRHEVIHRLAR